MSSPAIFSGRRTKLLTADGILNSNGSINDNDGVPNFIKNGHAEVNTAGWATYADSAASRPEDGTGGTSNINWTRDTGTPLAGAASFLFNKGAANRQGQGVSYDFTIDSAYQAKVLKIEFDYKVLIGSFTAATSTTDSDIIVYIYDVTNSTLIEPSTIKLFSNSDDVADRFSAYFQTAVNSTSYRLIFHVATTSTSFYTVKFDNITVSPSQYVYGTPITDWQSYTPTFTGFGTPTSIQFFWRRLGDSLNVKGFFVSGISTATEARISFPSGLTARASSLPSVLELVGYAGRGAADNNQHQVYAEPNVSYFTFGTQSSVETGLTKKNGSALVASGNSYSFFALVPISGWSSSVQMSDSADTRVVALSVTRTSNFTQPSGQNNLVYNSVLSDTHGAYNATTGAYTVPVAGNYVVRPKILTNNNNGTATVLALEVTVNGNIRIADYLPAGQVPINQFVLLNGEVLLENLKVGDVIRVRTRNDGISYNYLGATSPDSGNTMSISRISGPSAIAATETIAASYSLSANQSLTANTTDVLFDVRELDTHLAYNTANGRFTAPATGIYEVSLKSFSTTTNTKWNIYKNGTLYRTLHESLSNLMSTGTAFLRLNAGEYVTIRASTTSTISGGSFSTDSTAIFQVKRIGL